jgi:hypothetical protein
MNKLTKTYCALPWSLASLLTGGVIAPCCSWFGVDKFANVFTLKEYFVKHLNFFKNEIHK